MLTVSENRALIYLHSPVCGRPSTAGTRWINHSAAFPQARRWVPDVLTQMPVFPVNSLTVGCMLWLKFEKQFGLMHMKKH